jgi:hypothetical protein
MVDEGFTRRFADAHSLGQCDINAASRQAVPKLVCWRIPFPFQLDRKWMRARTHCRKLDHRPSLFRRFGSGSHGQAYGLEFVMVSSALALALLLLAANPNQARKSYMSCLNAFVRSSVEKEMKAEDFDNALAPACSAQESSFR